MATILVAYDESLAIGHNNTLPWSLPEDLVHFRSTTMGQAVIMGRKTYESIPDKFRPLPKRLNIVLTTQPISEEANTKHVVWVNSPEEAVKVADQNRLIPYVIGGQQVYKCFLDAGLVFHIIASEVKGVHEADAFFPILSNDWSRVVVKSYDKFKIVEYCRRNSNHT